MRLILTLFICLYLSGCATVIKTPFNAQVTGDGKYWILNSPLKYEVDGVPYEVPKGFVTDLASVPRVFWVAFPPCAKYTPAAVIHDYIYWIQPENCNQKCADDILLSAMENLDVPWRDRTAIYKAVQFFGEDAWKDNKKLKTSGVRRIIPDEFERKDPYETWEMMEVRLKKYISTSL